MTNVIIFDLDDTLYKEIDFVQSAFREISGWLEGTYAIEGVYEVMIKTFHQGLNVFSMINHDYSLQIELEEYLCRYRNHVPRIKLEKEIATVLTMLSEKACKLGILTDGRRITQNNKINSLELSRYISNDNYIISEIFGHSKPSLEGYQYFSQKWDRANYYYVGDNTSKDFIAPNKLGWNTVCLLDDGRNIHKQDFSLPINQLPKQTIQEMVNLLHLIPF